MEDMKGEKFVSK